MFLNQPQNALDQRGVDVGAELIELGQGTGR